MFQPPRPRTQKMPFHMSFFYEPQNTFLTLLFWALLMHTAVRIYGCTVVKKCLTIAQVRAHALKIKTTGVRGQLFTTFPLNVYFVPFYLVTFFSLPSAFDIPQKCVLFKAFLFLQIVPFHFRLVKKRNYLFQTLGIPLSWWWWRWWWGQFMSRICFGHVIMISCKCLLPPKMRLTWAIL